MVVISHNKNDKLVSITVGMVNDHAQESNCLVTLYCQSFLYEIISGLRSACIDVASSSAAPPAPLTTKPTNELLSEAIPMTDIVYQFSFVHEFPFCCLFYSL